MFGKTKLQTWAALGGCVCAATGFGAQNSKSAPANESGATTSCSDYNLIDVHGSGAASYTESPAGSVLAEQLQMSLSPKQVEVDTVPFEAAGGPITLAGAALKLPRGYHQSVVKIKNWLREWLQALPGDCPNAKVILVGYSQGAQAVGDVYQERAWKQVVGVVLFGDPYYNHADSSDRFGLNFQPKQRIKTKLDGALVGRKPRDAFNSSLVQSYCHQEDFVCQAPLSKYELVRYGKSQHNNYTGFGEPEKAAKYLMGLIGSSGSPKPSPKPLGKWPTNRHDGPPALFLMLGANFISPDWSSCDPAYCIVGSDNTVYVFSVDQGINEKGTIPLGYTDPAEGLGELKVPKPDIDKLLAP